MRACEEVSFGRTKSLGGLGSVGGGAGPVADAVFSVPASLVGCFFDRVFIFV